MDSAATTDTMAEKKNPFDHLERDELIKKCKGLLSIAQKAKKAKDDHANESAALKTQLTELETSRTADIEQLKTMQLIVESTTDQKLALTTRIEQLERQLGDANGHVNDLNQKLLEANTKFSALDIECEGHRKQNKRLTEENEEQENDLRELDTRLQQQKQELLKLEQSVENWKHIEVEHERLIGVNRTLQATIDANQLAETNRQADADLLEKYEKLKCDFDANVIELNELRASVEASNDEKSVELEKLTKENQLLQGQMDEQRQKLSKYKSKMIEFATKLKSLKQCKEALLSTVSEYSVSVAKWQQDITTASKLLVQQVNQLHTENVTKTEELRSIESTAKELQTERDALSAQLQELSSKCADANREQEERANSLLESHEEKDAFAVKLAQSEADLKEAIDRRELIEKQNEDLLAEMRELNDALKNRGNVISKQTNELETVRVNHQEQNVRIAQLEDALREKTKSLDQLKAQFESQSDIMSTSTMSRAEDVARMRDIEDSFEEKYNKLRGLAIKQKKRIAELQATITRLDKTPAAESPAVESTNIKIQNMKSMQAENDRLMDQIDAMKNERKEMQAADKKLTAALVDRENEMKSLRLANEDAQALADTHSKTKCALDEALRNGEAEKERLRNEIKRLKDAQAASEAEIARGKDLSEAKESECAAHTEQVSKLKAELGKLRASMKKNSVLNLEMEAYEKSSKEMTQKLEAKVVQLAEMETANMSKEATNKSLRNEIKQLHESVESERQSATESQQECELLRIKLRDSINELTETKQTVDAHVRELALKKVELANLLSEQSQSEVDKQKLMTQWKNENEKNVGQLFTLEEQLRELTVKYNTTAQELAQVQTEFVNYKVRAQSVLRQNQSQDSSTEKELREEIDVLTRSKDELAAKLSTMADQNRQSNAVADELRVEKQSLHDRCKKLMDLLDETRQQVDTVQNEMRKQTQEHQEALKTHRLQIDTLNGCFKRQIDEMKATHDEQLAEWKAKTMTSITRHDQFNGNTLESNKLRGDDRATHELSSLSEEQQRIGMILTERQAGEGSENTGSLRKVSGTRNRHELIPLDELLFENQDEGDEHVEEPVSTLDVEAAKEKMAMQQSQVNHLSSLLAEAECDVARLTQMNDVLKEEVRRQERSTEREMHMHNLEYMKNIIFKFLTINNADERAHLVPVLNTILKLSADECKQLQSVAKGGDATQSTWSNILPTMW